MMWGCKDTDGKVYFSGYVASGTTQALRHLFRVMIPPDEQWKSWTYHCTCKMINNSSVTSRNRLCAHIFGILYLFAGVQRDFGAPWKSEASRFAPMTIHKTGKNTQRIFGKGNYPTVDWFVERCRYDSLNDLLGEFCLANIEHASPQFDHLPSHVVPRK